MKCTENEVLIIRNRVRNYLLFLSRQIGEWEQQISELSLYGIEDQMIRAVLRTMSASISSKQSLTETANEEIGQVISSFLKELEEKDTEYI